MKFSMKPLNLSLTVKIGLIFCVLSVGLFGPVIYFYYSNSYNLIRHQLVQRIQSLGNLASFFFTQTEIEHIQKLAGELDKASLPLNFESFNWKAGEMTDSLSKEDRQRLIATEDFQQLARLLRHIQEGTQTVTESPQGSEHSQVVPIYSPPIIRSLHLVVAMPQVSNHQLLKILISSQRQDSTVATPQLGTLYVVEKPKSAFWASAFAGNSVTEQEFYHSATTVTLSTAIPLKNLNRQTSAVLSLELNVEEEFRQLKRLQWVSIGLLPFSMILSLLLAFLFGRWLQRPLAQLQLATQRICGHDFNTTVDIQGGDELGQLATAFNSMITEVRCCIQSQQNRLATSDKMAALGNRVAGFSHEVNTPLGLCVTAGSFLEDTTKKIAGLYRNGNLKRNDLEKYFNDVGEGYQILLKNLQRAADLIKSFKHIAIDEAGEMKRTFNLKEYLEEILLTLKPALKRTEYHVTIVCPEELTLCSYPGIFSQIIINLIMNSLIHGFKNRTQGQITIQAGAENQQLILHYQDDGVGIAPDIIDKIFDPFFTTNLEGGGSGLGLHIIHELVTHNLKGTIRCESVMGEGTAFIITVPQE